MSSSVAAEAFRVDEWDRETAGNTDDIAEVESRTPQTNGIAGTSQAAMRTPPWPHRRLNDVLAGLGPARPDVPPPSLPADPTDFGDADPLPSAAPDVVAEPADNTPSPESPIEARPNLPPPPRPVRKAIGDPFETVISNQAVFGWDDAALPDVDAAGADIVRALAFADQPPVHAPAPAFRSFVVGHLGDHSDDLERPPMIIERALAEQGLGLLGVVPAARRINPLPALTFGFSLSLLASAALYIFMMVG
jgi:hypothetical protein